MEPNIDDEYEQVRVKNYVGGDSVGSWLRSVAFWDGVMPVLAFTFPAVVKAVGVPNEVDSLVVVLLLVLFFLIRMHVGINRVQWNLRWNVQHGLFTLGVLLLLFLESLAAAMALGPNGRQQIEGVILLLPIYAIYFVVMGIALFPVKAVVARTD